MYTYTEMVGPYDPPRGQGTRSLLRSSNLNPEGLPDIAARARRRRGRSARSEQLRRCSYTPTAMTSRIYTPAAMVLDLLLSMEYPAIDRELFGGGESNQPEWMATSPDSGSEGSEPVDRGRDSGDFDGTEGSSNSDSGIELCANLSGDGAQEDSPVHLADFIAGRFTIGSILSGRSPITASKSAPDPKQWKKRLRHREIPDFRPPTNARISAFEATIRNFGDRKT